MKHTLIARAVHDVADYVQDKMGSGAFDIFPGSHPRTQAEREARLQSNHKVAADKLRQFASRSETEPVKLAEFETLIYGMPIPDKIRKPAEWAIYDRYGA